MTNTMSGIKDALRPCCHASPRWYFHRAITTTSSYPVPHPDTFTSHTPHTHTHRHPAHLHIRTRTCAQPRHPSPHHPQTSPLFLFQGAHGKPPESAGLRRTWAWPNSFPWLWTWDHPLLIFLSYPFLYVAFAFLFPHPIDLSWPLGHLYPYLLFFSLLSSSPPPHPLLYLLISAPGTGIWKSFCFFLKGFIHTRHILLD